MNVDAIQSANVVRVVGDQGYAALFADLQLNQSAHSRDFNRTCHPTPRKTRALASSRRRSLPRPRHRRHLGSRHARSLSDQHSSAHHSAPAAATRHHAAVVVPADLWPAYSCRELGGAGWAATIRRVHASTARVSFNVAQTRDGRPYEDELLPLDELRVVAV